MSGRAIPAQAAKRAVETAFEHGQDTFARELLFMMLSMSDREEGDAAIVDNVLHVLQARFEVGMNPSRWFAAPDGTV